MQILKCAYIMICLLTGPQKLLVLHTFFRRETESEMNSIKDQINMYQSSVSTKDETIMSLTNKIFDLECNAGQNAAQQTLTAINMAEMDKLKARECHFNEYIKILFYIQCWLLTNNSYNLNWNANIHVCSVSISM